MSIIRDAHLRQVIAAVGTAITLDERRLRVVLGLAIGVNDAGVGLGVQVLVPQHADLKGQGAVEVCVVDVEPFQLLAQSELGGDGAGERVVVEHEHLQFREFADALAERPVESLVSNCQPWSFSHEGAFEPQFLESCQLVQVRGKFAKHGVSVEMKLLETVQ